MIATAVASPCSAAGVIDASTVIAVRHGVYRGVQYTRYEAMFDGVTSNRRPYRVPCQIIAPRRPSDGSGLLLFDWLVGSTIPTAVGQEQPDARYTMTDDFLFGLGLSYATVRCDPEGNKIGFSNSEKPPLEGAGLEIDFQTETDVAALGAHKTRHEESNYRAYQFAGAAHIRDIDILEFGLPDPETANPAEWTPFIRALFVAGEKWCDGVLPPPSLWLGAPNDPTIVRDAKGNARIRFVGRQPVNTDAFRLRASEA